jgi:hypothetical protein
MRDFGTDASTLLFLAGVILLLFTLVRMARRRSARSAEARPALSQPSTRAGAGPAAEQYEVRLYETFRELHARLETKIAVLNALIEEADRKIAELRPQFSRGAPGGSVGGDNPVVVDPDEAGGDDGPAAAGFEEIYRLADLGMTPAAISRKLDQPAGEIELILRLRRFRRAERRRESG